MANGNNSTANDAPKTISYAVNGEEVTLSRTIVRNFLTRGNAAITDGEIVQFISLCKANLLNPFIGDAYMVKYQARDGERQEGAQMIISKSAFMKRAEGSPLYNGYKAGVILLRNKQIVEEDGSFFLPGDELVGGWAKVYRKDREYPVIARVRLQEYNKNRSTWRVMPATMIRKVAIAQAFREAFPLTVEGMYIPEELPEDQPQEQQQLPAANSIKPVFTDEDEKDAPSPEPAPDPEPDFQPDPVPVEAPDPEPAEEEDPNLNLFTV